ncbi:MAG TPA: subclass B3 metallo-beta-lactamase [Terriglobales bacterium]|nr:subclass B3 metallo-beta-lactamase [Terriglobales bacterium]
MKSLFCLFTLLSSLLLFGQSNPEWRSWNQPVEPFRIVGNVYYVGASDITAFLITSPKGHILLDGGFVETAPMIRDNIRKLGFNPEDIQYLINSHAHSDHAAGLAQLKKWTGAKFVASREDGALIARGGHGDFAWGDRYLFPALKPDQAIADGGTVSVGGVTMTAHLTPGHTKGCTTWTTDALEKGHRYHVVFLCSTSMPGYKLVKNANYPNIVSDYRHSFATLKTLPCDVFLGPHGSFFDLAGKRKEMRTDPSRNPFIVPGEFNAFIERSQRDFERELEKQQRTP